MQLLEVVRTIPLDEAQNITLVRRAHSGTDNGLWELPGGKIEPGQSVVSAAKAETEQETGLQIELIGQPQIITQYEILDGKYAGRVYRASCSIARIIGGTPIRRSDETDGQIQVTYDEAMRIVDLRDKSREALQKMAGPLIKHCLKA